jgi:flagellar basal body rod protein FlgC
MDISSIALQGVQQAQVQLDNSVQRLTQATSGDVVDLSQEAVALLSAKNQFSANINVLKIAGNMQKNVINLLG